MLIFVMSMSCVMGAVLDVVIDIAIAGNRLPFIIVAILWVLFSISITWNYKLKRW